MDFTKDKRTHFIADAPRGGGSGENDPHDYDDQLARQFKFALRHAFNSLTAGTRELHESIKGIEERVKQEGLTILLSRDLQPIAKRLMELGPSDRYTPGCLEKKFEGFDLTTQP